MTDYTNLLTGYRRFRANGWTQQRARWAELSEGQHPRTMVIACSDSRCDPAVIFDTSPGEIFVVRNIANLVPPYEVGGGRHGVSAALEFAVAALEVRDIVVMGHGMCGGCGAALSQAYKDAKPGEGGFIAHWIDLLDDARDRIVAEHGDDLHGPARLAMEQETVKVSLANLRTFPNIARREELGLVTLHGAHFAIADGILYLLDEKNGTFEPA